ncbi:hypothetical protein Mgra_00008089, partial [Meloidogyne graminicola]
MKKEFIYFIFILINIFFNSLLATKKLNKKKSSKNKELKLEKLNKRYELFTIPESQQYEEYSQVSIDNYKTDLVLKHENFYSGNPNKTLNLYSKNFQQLISCIEFFSNEENKESLFLIISKIKNGIGKPMLKLQGLNQFYELWKKFENKADEIDKVKSLNEENVKEEEITNQQLIDIKTAVTLGYLRYLYMDDFCKNVNEIYTNNFQVYLNDFCKKKVK